MFPNRKLDIYTCDSHCPFKKGLKGRHGISGFYDKLFIFKFLDLVWGGHEKVWNLVMVFELKKKTNMVWGQMGKHHIIFFSLTNFGFKGGLAERRVGWFFFSLSLIMGGATMGGHGHIFFIKNRSLVGWGEG